MKTVKGLHEKMGTFENANTSFHQAARCKRYTNEVLAFSMVKEEELLRATEEIQNAVKAQMKKVGLTNFRDIEVPTEALESVLAVLE